MTPSAQGDGDPGDTVPSYDDKQINAVLVTCAGCGRAWYMTWPHALCLACRRAA